MSLNLYSFVITFRADGLFPEAWLCLCGLRTHFGRKSQHLYSFVFLKKPWIFENSFWNLRVTLLRWRKKADQMSSFRPDPCPTFWKKDYRFPGRYQQLVYLNWWRLHQLEPEALCGDKALTALVFLSDRKKSVSRSALLSNPEVSSHCPGHLLSLGFPMWLPEVKCGPPTTGQGCLRFWAKQFILSLIRQLKEIPCWLGLPPTHCCQVPP